MCWTIWRARNDFIFRQISPVLQFSKGNFREEAQLLLLMIKGRFRLQFSQWIDDLQYPGLSRFFFFPSLFLELFPLVLLVSLL
jgi:hypothetical protein